MNKKKSLSALILFTLCFAVIAQVSAQVTEVTIGVSVGNTFKYQLTAYWNTTNPSDTVPISLVDQNNTAWIQATITVITGNTATITLVQHFKNGTDVTTEEITSVGTSNQLSIYLYASNLNAGDFLLPSSQLPDYIVNSTVSRSYAGGARDTNYMENTLNNVNTDTDETTIEYLYIYSTRYFDRQTGILVEGYFEYETAANPDQAYAFAYKLIESNVWNVSGSTVDSGTSWLTTDVQYVIIIVVVLVVVVVALLLIRMKKRKSKTKRS